MSSMICGYDELQFKFYCLFVMISIIQKEKHNKGNIAL